MAKYVLDENNNKIEVTDEVGNTTVHEVKCCVSNTPYKMAFVTQAKYNELKAAGLLQLNAIYEIIDDTTADEIEAQLLAQGNTIKEMQAKHLYEHNLKLTSTSDGNTLIMYLKILNNSETKLTKSTVKSYFSTKANEGIMATGVLKGGSTTYPITSISYSNGDYLINTAAYLTINGTSTIVTSGFSLYEANMSVTDFVRQIY